MQCRLFLIKTGRNWPTLAIFMAILPVHPVAAQQLDFRGFPVDTIRVESSSGYYHFDKKGTTTGKTDVYVIAFDSVARQYGVVDYQRIRLKATYRPDMVRQKIRHFRRQKGKAVSQVAIEGLLSAFASGTVPPTFENTGLDDQIFLALTDEKHIRKMAKAHKRGWYFDPDYSTRAENEAIFTGCQSIDTFNLFLSSEMVAGGYVIITDVWDEMNVFISAPDTTFRYEGKYPNLLKQPWYDHSDSLKALPKSIIQLNINRFLLEILPDNFNSRHTLEWGCLFDRYIRWYLERRGILYQWDRFP